MAQSGAFQVGLVGFREVDLLQGQDGSNVGALINQNWVPLKGSSKGSRRDP